MNENVNVCITPKGEKPVLHFSQFDNERVFTVTVLADDGESAAVLTGLDIELRVRKTDSHVVTIASESVSDNVITFKTTEQMCACCGQNIASVVLMKDDMIISTLDILVDIQRDILSGGLTSESDIRNLTTQIEQIVPEVIGDDYYNKQEVDDLLAEHTFDPTNYYNKSDVDGLLADKADASDVYTKGETDTLLADKADIDDVMVKITKHGIIGDMSFYTFNNNCIAPMDDIECDVEAVQDLHGYSKPWSGGGGKNKLNYDAWKTVDIIRGTAVFENNGVTLTATGNDSYTDFSNKVFPVDARVPITEGETITLSWQETTNTFGTVAIFPNGTTSGIVTVNNAAVKKATYTATSGITFVTFRFGVTNSGDTIAYKNIQIEKGNQATAWEPYSNICPISGHSSGTITVADSDNTPVNTVTVSFGQEVYGGVADVTGGKLTITHVIKNIGANDISDNGTSGGLIELNVSGTGNKKNGQTNMICNNLEVRAAAGAYVIRGRAGSSNVTFCLPTSDVPDFASAQTWVTNNPIELVYELTTPVEVTFTPVTTDTINGSNKVSSSTGNMKSLTYFSDVNSDLVDLIRACMI